MTSSDRPLCVLQAFLLEIFLLCTPAHPTCPILPRIIMNATKLPATFLDHKPVPVRAACAVAGWCAEGWLQADKQLLHEAALTLIAALRDHCES
jgi:hypothetical protein